MKAKYSDAFTLIELIVVIIIIGILGSIAVPSYTSYLKSAKNRANETLAERMNDAIDEYRLSHGNVPDKQHVFSVQDVINYQSGVTSTAAGWEIIIMSKFQTIPVNAFCINNKDLANLTWEEFGSSEQLDGWYMLGIDIGPEDSVIINESIANRTNQDDWGENGPPPSC